MQSNHHEELFSRLGQWISKQGIVFQLQHPLGSNKTRVFIQSLSVVVLRLFSLTCITLIICSIWVYFLPNKASFENKLRSSLQSTLQAETLSMEGCNRNGNKLEIAKIIARAGNKSFFSDLGLYSIQSELGWFDGILGMQDPGIIQIDKMEAQLNAGFSNAELSETVGKIVFQDASKLPFKSIQISDATLQWGYFSNTFGRIEKSKMTIIRLTDSWKVQLEGGTFSMNWMQQIPIEKIIATITPDRILFEQATFLLEKQKITAKNLNIKTGSSPELEGSLIFKHVPLEAILTKDLDSKISGVMNTTFLLKGSLNQTSGITYSTTMQLSDDAPLVLTDKIPLLRTLTFLDSNNSYRKVTMNQGSIEYSISPNGIHIKSIDIQNNPTLKVSGSFQAYLPENKTEGKLKSNTLKDGSGKELSLKMDSVVLNPKSDKIVKLSDKSPILQNQMIEPLTPKLLTQGKINFYLNPDAFETSPSLQKLYAVDPSTKKIKIEVNVQDSIEDFTKKKSQDLYEESDRNKK